MAVGFAGLACQGMDALGNHPAPGGTILENRRPRLGFLAADLPARYSSALIWSAMACCSTDWLATWTRLGPRAFCSMASSIFMGCAMGHLPQPTGRAQRKRPRGDAAPHGLVL